MRVEKRLALLEANRKEDATGYRLPNRTIKYIRDKSLPTVLHDIAEGPEHSRRPASSQRRGVCHSRGRTPSRTGPGCLSHRTKH